MKSFFNELIKYSFDCNQQLAEVLTQNQEKVSAKSQNLLSHLISAHQIWNARVLASELTFEVWQLHSVKDFKKINEDNFQNSLKIISEFELDQIINYKNSKGLAFENTVQDVLFHIINHSTYHRAQIATELKLVGIEPLSTDWIMYKR